MNMKLAKALMTVNQVPSQFQSLLTTSLKVKDLVVMDEREWNIELLTGLFHVEERKLIEKIRPRL